MQKTKIICPYCKSINQEDFKYLFNEMGFDHYHCITCGKAFDKEGKKKSHKTYPFTFFTFLRIRELFEISFIEELLQINFDFFGYTFKTKQYDLLLKKSELTKEESNALIKICKTYQKTHEIEDLGDSLKRIIIKQNITKNNNQNKIKRV